MTDVATGGPVRAAVFCGANPGSNPAFLRAAHDLGEALAQARVALVYGGASIGLMGALADAAVAAGGHVTGVVPQFLPDGKVHRGLAELHVVATMHERKARMAELAHAVVVLPGGLGTLDELFEVLTLGQLGLHDKPVVLLDVDGFFRPLLGFLDHVHRCGLVLAPASALVTLAGSVAEVLAVLRPRAAAGMGGT